MTSTSDPLPRASRRPRWAGRALAAGAGVLSILSVVGCSSSPHSKQNIAADKAAARAASLKLSDLPSSAGWAPFNTPSEDLGSSVAGCLGASAASPAGAPAGYTSGNFSNGPDGPDIVSSAVGYWATANDAKRSFDVLSKPGFPKCARTAIKAQVEYELNGLAEQGATFSDPTVSPIPFPTIGDRTIAHQAELTVTAGKESEEVSVDDVLSLDGRALVEIVYSESGEAGEGPGRAQADDAVRSTAEHYTRVVVDRLAHASPTPPGK